MKLTDSPVSRKVLRSAVWICVAALSAGPLAAAHEPGYGFYRTVEGDVRLTTLDRAEALDVEPNYPLLLGDRVWVSPAGRLEAVLPDQTLIRAAGNTDVYFEDLALYADEDAGQGTILRLLEGEIQVVVARYTDRREPVRVDTPNATIYLQEAGVYRIYADDRQWTEVVVREGFGEVALADGSIVVRANEEAVVDGEIDPRVRVYPAGALDALEAWGQDLDREAELAKRETYVDESLRYQAAPLREHGTWISVDAGYAWRPYVSVGWRPYTRGYWTYTPAGHYWVSAEPWGLTFHYGSWSLHPYHGWIWYPGTVFAPARVTWYWGPTYVGWVPSGYYSYYYGHRPGLSFGFYGWAGGSWSYYSAWTFCPTGYFGWRSYGTYWRSGSEIARVARGDVPRGAILGSTRGIPRGYVGRPDEVVRLVRPLPGVDRGVGGKVPDVTDFVARRAKLTAEVRDVVFAKEAALAKSRAQSAISSQGRDAQAVRLEAPRSASGDRGAIGDRGSEPVRSLPSRTLPSRPDLSRQELVAREPLRRDTPGATSADRSDRGQQVVREPLRSATPSRPVDSGGSDRFDRGTASRVEPTRETPRSIAPTSPARPAPRVEPGASTMRYEPREPLGRAEDAGSRERAPLPPRPDLGQPLSSGPRALPVAPSDPRSGGDDRPPVVRRVLDGIRGLHSPSTPSPGASPSPSAPPSASTRPSASAPTRPSPPPSSSSPSVSRPSSSPSSSSSSVRRPTSSPPPQASRPSSGSSVRGSSGSQSSRASSASSSSSSSRSQSRTRSKPPGE